MRIFNKKIKLLLSLAATLSFFTFSVFAEASYDDYIVCFKDRESADAAIEYIDSFASLFSETASSSNISEINEKRFLYTLDNPDLIKLFEEEGLIEYSEPNYYMELFDYDYEANEYFSRQWEHTLTKVSAAWDLGIYGNDVTVAVIDTGIDTDHPDLIDNIVPGFNALTYDETEMFSDDVEDTVGHGTNVAGVIAASADNIAGVVGVAHRAKIMPIKADRLNDNGEVGIPFSAAASAILAFVDYRDIYNVDVINMSCGKKDSTSIDSRTLKGMIEEAVAAGIIVCASAGNYGNSSSKNVPMYPASFDCVISVGNLKMNADGTYEPHETSQDNEYVDIIAPGTNIRSTSINGKYDTVIGTSFASPYVAAVAALAKSVDPSIDTDAFFTLLTETADKTPLGGASHDTHYGYGILDVDAFIKRLISERAQDAFISPVDRRNDGKITVTVYNPTSSPITAALIAKTVSGTRPLSIIPFDASLGAGKTKEIELTELNGSSSADIHAYILDNYKLNPLYKTVISKLP